MKKRYTVGQLAKLADISARTLRHYEEQGLLVPARTTNGYRSYSQDDAKRLAHILSMRSCGLPLATIKQLIDASDARDGSAPHGETEPLKRNAHEASAQLRKALLEHLSSLRAQMDSLEESLANTQAAIDALERIEDMNEKDAFEAMKAQKIQQNEEAYGQEARQRHGNEAVDATNERLMAMSQAEWDSKEQLEEAIKGQLRLALEAGDPFAQAAAELAAMHAQWIKMHWGEAAYSKEAHLGLAHGYLADARFQDYYDSACGEGSTQFLVEALKANL